MKNILVHHLSRHPRMLRMFPAIVLSSALAVTLLAYRVAHTSSTAFLFLTWNLFLAWIPFVLSLALHRHMRMPGWVRAGVFITWLLFLPNAPYILTDLVHLHQRSDMPYWFDMLLILSFAWSGLVLGLASLFNVHAFLKSSFGSVKAWLAVLVVQGLCGFGIYLGRFLRLNSWDAFTDPLATFRTSCSIVLHPFANIHATGFTLIISGFLLASYLFFAGVMMPAGKGVKDV